MTFVCLKQVLDCFSVLLLSKINSDYNRMSADKKDNFTIT